MHVMHAVAEPQERYLPQGNAGSYIRLETLAHPTTSLEVSTFHLPFPSPVPLVLESFLRDALTQIAMIESRK